MDLTVTATDLRFRGLMGMILSWKKTHKRLKWLVCWSDIQRNIIESGIKTSSFARIWASTFSNEWKRRSCKTGIYLQKMYQPSFPFFPLCKIILTMLVREIAQDLYFTSSDHLQPLFSQYWLPWFCFHGIKFSNLVFINLVR